MEKINTVVIMVEPRNDCVVRSQQQKLSKQCFGPDPPPPVC